MDSRLLAAVLDVLTASEIDLLAAHNETRGIGAGLQQSMLDIAAAGSASTGTPIPELHGIAATNATLAAVGGGSKAAGGGGVAGGHSRLNQAALSAQLATIGITSAAIVARILARYVILVRRDRIRERGNTHERP